MQLIIEQEAFLAILTIKYRKNFQYNKEFECLVIIF